MCAPCVQRRGSLAQPGYLRRTGDHSHQRPRSRSSARRCARCRGRSCTSPCRARRPRPRSKRSRGRVLGLVFVVAWRRTGARERGVPRSGRSNRGTGGGSGRVHVVAEREHRPRDVVRSLAVARSLSVPQLAMSPAPTSTGSRGQGDCWDTRRVSATPCGQETSRQGRREGVHGGLSVDVGCRRTSSGHACPGSTVTTIVAVMSCLWMLQ